MIIMIMIMNLIGHSIACFLDWLVVDAVNNPRDNQLINWTTGGVISAL